MAEHLETIFKFNFLFQEELEDKKKDWLIRLVQGGGGERDGALLIFEATYLI